MIAPTLLTPAAPAKTRAGAEQPAASLEGMFALAVESATPALQRRYQAPSRSRTQKQLPCHQHWTACPKRFNCLLSPHRQRQSQGWHQNRLPSSSPASNRLISPWTILHSRAWQWRQLLMPRSRQHQMSWLHPRSKLRRRS